MEMLRIVYGSIYAALFVLTCTAFFVEASRSHLPRAPLALKQIDTILFLSHGGVGHTVIARDVFRKAIGTLFNLRLSLSLSR